MVFDRLLGEDGRRARRFDPYKLRDRAGVLGKNSGGCVGAAAGGAEALCVWHHRRGGDDAIRAATFRPRTSAAIAADVAGGKSKLGKQGGVGRRSGDKANRTRAVQPRKHRKSQRCDHRDQRPHGLGVSEGADHLGVGADHQDRAWLKGSTRLALGCGPVNRPSMAKEMDILRWRARKLPIYSARKRPRAK